MPLYQDLRDAPEWVRDYWAESRARMEALFRSPGDMRGIQPPADPTPPPTFTLEQRLALYSDDPEEARQLRAARIVESGEGETIVTEDDYLRYPYRLVE